MPHLQRRYLTHPRDGCKGEDKYIQCLPLASAELCPTRPRHKSFECPPGNRCRGPLLRGLPHVGVSTPQREEGSYLCFPPAPNPPFQCPEEATGITLERLPRDSLGQVG